MIRNVQFLAAFQADATCPACAKPRAFHVFGPGRCAQGGIVIATINRPTGDTGVHTHTRALHEGLSAAHVPCRVVSPFSQSPWWLPVFAARRVFLRLSPEHSLHWYRRWHAAALRGNLRRQLLRHDSAAILAQCPVSAAAALEVRADLGVDIPVAMVCHFNYSEATEYRERGELRKEKNFEAMLHFERQVLSGVDHVIYVSGWAKRIVEQERNIAVKASTVVWNGIDENVNAAAVSKEALGFSADDVLLINVGTLEQRKNQLGLLSLFEELLNVCPQAKLALVGDGPDRALIETKIAERALASRVRLLGHRRDVPALLASADLYIHYAGLENCPVVLIEAARAGLPLAAVPKGGVPELLAALNGFAVDSENLPAAVETLRPLLADSNLRKTAGALSAAAFRASFTRQAMVGAYLTALEVAKKPAALEAK